MTLGELTVDDMTSWNDARWNEWLKWLVKTTIVEMTLDKMTGLNDYRWNEWLKLL